jgi:Recombination endonuclease VII
MGRPLGSKNKRPLSEARRAQISEFQRQRWAMMRADTRETLSYRLKAGHVHRPAKWLYESVATYSRWKRYRVTPEMFRAMWQRQGGLCAICARELFDRKGGVSIDHDHSKPKGASVRGLLCVPCNAGVGFLELHGTAAVAYLEKQARVACAAE